MKRTTLVVLLCTLISLSLFPQGAVLSQDFQQPDLGYRSVEILEVDGYQFKDLNKNGELDPYEDWRLPVEERVEDLLSQMTLAEKVGQMFYPSVRPEGDGTLSAAAPSFSLYTAADTVLIKKMTHILPRLSDAVVMATFNNEIQELAESGTLGIPVTIASDPRNHYNPDPLVEYMVTAGAYSQWPATTGLAAIGDVALVEEFARIVNQEYRATGIRMALHPQIDLATEPRWRRISGTFGEDAELSAALTEAYVKGLQGEVLSPQSVEAMIKHFPGNGPQWQGYDSHNSWGRWAIYPGDNFAYHLIPFKAGIDAGAGAVMTLYSIPWNQTSENVATSFNKEILTDLLRNEWGFEGVITTDWGIPTGRPWGLEELTLSERYEKALNAGVDQFGGNSDVDVVLELVNDGKISEERINESVRRLLRDTFTLGLFENPYVDLNAIPSLVGTPESQALADEAQRRSIVLLQNSETEAGSSILPLAAGTKIYVEGINSDIAAQYGQVVENLDDADVAILRVRAPSENPVEGFGVRGDVTETGGGVNNLGFWGEELAHLRSIIDAKPTVIDVQLDRPAILTRIADAEALLGTFGVSDAALLDVIFGEFAPTGKLPFELPSSMDAVEVQLEDMPYDSENPLFEFGFGLTY